MATPFSDLVSNLLHSTSSIASVPLVSCIVSDGFKSFVPSWGSCNSRHANSLFVK